MQPVNKNLAPTLPHRRPPILILIPELLLLLRDLLEELRRVSRAGCLFVELQGVGGLCWCGVELG